VLIAVGAIALNVVLSLVFMQLWPSLDPDHRAFGGLALANSIAAIVEAAVLLRAIGSRLPDLDVQGLTVSAVRTLAASLVMALPVAWLAGQLDPLLRPYGSPGQALLLVTCISSGALLYAVASLAFRSDEIYALWRLVRPSTG
jgi:peptidoglycan biosynthesis protein MviN/MurJ (putative lipid II flippase)